MRRAGQAFSNEPGRARLPHFPECDLLLALHVL
jgi:hypothetical protein